MEHLIRCISSANKQTYPENLPAQFTNEIKPPIVKIKSIGICEITFNIQYNDQLKNSEYLNNNSFFFVNCDIINGQRIANQNINSLNEFSINILTYVNENTPTARLVYKFNNDFMYLDLNNLTEVENISFLITNLIGETHPLITGSTTIILKYTDMDNSTNTVLRIVSSANKQDNPFNNALNFKNFLKPPVLNVDSVGLSKITIPLISGDDTYLSRSRSLAAPYEQKFTNEFVRDSIKNYEFPEYINICTIRVFYQTVEGGLENSQSVLVDIPKGTKIILEDEIKKSDDISLVTLIYFKLSARNKEDHTILPNNFNWYFSQSGGIPTEFNIHIEPGPEMKVFKITKIIIESIKNMLYDYKPLVLFLVPSDTIWLEDENKNPNITIFSMLNIVYFPPRDTKIWDNPKWSPYGVKDDVILVTSDNVDSISYGQHMMPILQIIPLNQTNFNEGNISFTIPDTNFYLCRTNTSVLDSFSIKLLNQDLEEHKLIDKDRTTIASLIISYGSNSEI
ncbi:MAG: hypothetical protein ACRDDH_00075 [Cetobacterium sp.]|uniref:hypothetical protein n=1 Tax=Cetobacterium sp. TaxID=2071632 RepID=UPI003EE78A8B